MHILLIHDKNHETDSYLYLAIITFCKWRLIYTLTHLQCISYAVFRINIISVRQTMYHKEKVTVMMSLLLYDFETGFNLDNDKDGCEIWAGYMPPPPPPPQIHIYTHFLHQSLWPTKMLSHTSCSERPKPLFWFRYDTETETLNGRYFRPIP